VSISLSELPRTGLSGNLHLVCSAHPDRGTFLSQQSFSAPMHLNKTYWNGDTLLVNVVNQTAGVFGGDCITTQVTVESSARVLLSSPSAARFHPSHGRESRLQQTYKIHSGGSLDIFPEISIPQRDSRSFQKTDIQVESGGELLYLETLTPGRVASGEVFAFDRYAWSTDIAVGNRLVHRERASITPRDSSTAGLRALFPASYYASLILISPVAEKWETDFPHAVAQLPGDIPTKMAASRLNAHGWSIRILAGDSMALRESIRRLRALIYQRLNRPLPNPRRSGE
jgi:urease accessory protein